MSGNIPLVEKLKIVAEVLRSHHLSGSAKVTASALALVFMNGKTGQCNPSLATLADATGVSRWTAKRAVEDLIACGVISVRLSKSGDFEGYALASSWTDVTQPEGIRRRSGGPRKMSPKRHETGESRVADLVGSEQNCTSMGANLLGESEQNCTNLEQICSAERASLLQKSSKTAHRTYEGKPGRGTMKEPVRRPPLEEGFEFDDFGERPSTDGNRDEWSDIPW